MQLRFVGCGDALGSGGRCNTCFHVTGASVNFLIDCGASSLPALKRLGIAREAIATPPSSVASPSRPIAVVETMPISGVVRFATIAGPAMANTCAVVTFDG